MCLVMNFNEISSKSYFFFISLVDLRILISKSLETFIQFIFRLYLFYCFSFFSLRIHSLNTNNLRMDFHTWCLSWLLSDVDPLMVRAKFQKNISIEFQEESLEIFYIMNRRRKTEEKQFSEWFSFINNFFFHYSIKRFFS